MWKALVGRLHGKICHSHARLDTLPVHYSFLEGFAALPRPLGSSWDHMYICIPSPGDITRRPHCCRTWVGALRHFSSFWLSTWLLPAIFLPFPASQTPWVHEMVISFVQSFLVVKQFPSPGVMWCKLEGRFMIYTCGIVAARPYLFFSLRICCYEHNYLWKLSKRLHVFYCGDLNHNFGYQVWSFFFSSTNTVQVIF